MVPSGERLRRYAYLHVDVFTDRPFGGNPLSVFLDGEGLSAAEMQAIAREMNHSESTFLFPPAGKGAARVRIFTPSIEIPFAGHPVIGTAYVLAVSGKAALTAPRCGLTLELPEGNIETVLEGDSTKPSFVWMTQRPPESGSAVTDVDRLARALGVGRGDIALTDGASQVWSTGMPFLFVPLTGLTPIGRIRPNPQILHDLLHEVRASGLYAVTRETTRPDVVAHSRCFPIGVGVAEDAATGSAAGALGGYLLAHQWTRPGRCRIEQGIELGRPSTIHIEASGPGEAVRVGGHVVQVGRGELLL